MRLTAKSVSKQLWCPSIHQEFANSRSVMTGHYSHLAVLQREALADDHAHEAVMARDGISGVPLWPDVDFHIPRAHPTHRDVLPGLGPMPGYFAKPIIARGTMPFYHSRTGVPLPTLRRWRKNLRNDQEWGLYRC
jgi:hypothetical protein